MKTKNIIQRLCLFFFALLLAAPAWATDYGRFDYETFRSRNTVNAVGKKKPVGTLRQGRVEINFSDCRTTSGTGNSAIYELAKGSHFTVKVDDGYAIRWIILRDTEGGESYSNPKGKYRVSSVTSGYDYYFEKEAISNSGISGANHDNLNDDNNNIVVYNYDAPKKAVEIWTHNRSNWDQFKVRDIIVGYVRAPKVRFERDRYDIYYTSIPSSSFQPVLNYDTHNVHAEFKVDNNDIATVKANGFLKFKRPGTVVLTATCHASENCAKAQCSTTVTTKRDGVTFTSEGLPDVIFNNTSYSIRDYLYNSKTKSGKNFDYNDESFSVTSSNNAVLRYDDRWLKFGGTAGEATITFTQKETNFYEAASLSHTIIVARRDQYGTILIKDANEWKVFCKLVNEKGMTNLNARLEADINLGGDIAMIGRYDHKYAGTFDGQGHTLTLNWNTGESDIAPFRRVDGATIKNLRTAGTIKSSGHFLAGLIDEASGDNNTISNCVSAVNITSSYTSDRCGAGGLISYIYTNTQVTITDCLVKGSINGTGAGRTGMGGFVCYQYGTCTLNTCLYAGTNNGSNEYSYTFAPNATLNNCYYLNACGSEYKQGTKVTAEQLRNGAVAWMLQKGRSDMAWGQKIGRDDAPQLTRDNDKRICKVTFAYNGREEATRYANKGGTVASMPTFTPKDLLGSDYNEHHYYSGIAFEDGFNGSTTVNTDRTVAVTFNKKDYYEIASKENWKEFCDIVKSGQNAVDAKLTRNIDLGSEINMVAYDTKYSGTFDGQNHTLKLDWNNTNGTLAPFFKVENAIIRNLRTEGNIKSSYSNLSGLILTVSGKTTVKGCVSNVNITYTGNRECYSAGMTLSITYGAVVTFTDCIVKGKYNTTLEEGAFHISGFVLNQNGTCTFNNCLYLGDNVPGGDFTFTFYDRVTLNNCYYLNACGIAQGTKITAEQLKSGEVTKKLQNNRTDKCYWAQQLGGMPDFYNAADKSKANYVYYDAAKKGWVCDDFRLTDGTAMPIGLDFTAANVTYERDLSIGKATLCLPYDLYAQGFKAYTLSGGNKNEVHFKEVDDKLPAYTPYYITANGMPQLGGRNIEVKAYKADKMTTPAADYKFTGTVAGVSNATAAADNAYILQDDGKFHKVTTANSAATIPAYRAYIICPPQASGAKQLSVVLDGETTGIGSTTNEATDGKNGPVYDLQGRRVADRLDDARHRLPAGVYIVGGRKVVVK
ncbi:MAG: peptidase M26 [Prevotella buccae]|uniref:peptidase M26 n=1 Tax=Segatella buccae TaxID=28126 RepID=UPI00243311CA|nr:peptidase M26 [Segatella buccae]MBS5895056.1 peptidase M26 [Segatella buccae]